jgi:hypothetical protein
MIASVIERLKALYRRAKHRLLEYPIPDTGHEVDLVGRDGRGVTHVIGWRFNEPPFLRGRCGALVRTTTGRPGEVNCMTCLVKAGSR